MGEKVTIQDIADTLNLSRNTVSKALNGKNVPARTRNAVLNAAIEMGYKGYKLAASSDAAMGQKRFVILSTRLLLNINYYILVLRGMEENLLDYDVDLVQFRITNQESFSKFKHYLSGSKVDGIICMEFFEPKYIAELLEFETALVFLDFPIYTSALRGKYDIILPESQDVIRNFCMDMIRENNCQTFGFVGDYLHCRSFYERFTGMREALFFSSIPVDLRYSILNDDSMPYNAETLTREVSKLPVLPDCFVAANDAIAIYLLKALKNLKISVPKDVKVIGFDNVADAKNCTPPLTSVNVNKSLLGKRIISLLLDRIAHPMQAVQIIHIDSKLVIRSST